MFLKRIGITRNDAIKLIILLLYNRCQIEMGLDYT